MYFSKFLSGEACKNKAFARFNIPWPMKVCKVKTKIYSGYKRYITLQVVLYWFYTITLSSQTTSAVFSKTLQQNFLRKMPNPYSSKERSIQPLLHCPLFPGSRNPEDRVSRTPIFSVPSVQK